jgi:hypothetical protein
MFWGCLGMLTQMGMVFGIAKMVVSMLKLVITQVRWQESAPIKTRLVTAMGIVQPMQMVMVFVTSIYVAILSATMATNMPQCLLEINAGSQRTYAARVTKMVTLFL